MDAVGVQTQKRLRELRITSPSSHNNSTSSLTEGLAAAAKNERNPSPQNLNGHTPTPPIAVPQSSSTYSSRFNASGSDSFENHGNGKYANGALSKSPQRRRERGKSITFADHVQLDTGHQLPLQQPVPKDIPYPDKGDMSFEKYPIPNRNKSFDLWSETSSNDGSVSGRGSNYGSESDFGRYRNSSFSQTSSGRQAYEDGNDECNGNDYTDQEPVASLTSQSTASPISDEVKTPPSSDTYLSPVYESNRKNASSLQDMGAPWPWSLNNTNRSKSFNSMPRRFTRAQRKASCPSPMSPASLFLRNFKQPKAPEPDDEGQEIGNYIIGKTIGVGGFSVVKEAHTIENGLDVCRAVKIVKKRVREVETENDAIQAEFEHEVNLWRHLSHRYILDLISVYDTPFATFCITRYNIGGTLFDCVKNNRSGISPKLVQKYTYQICSALRYLHQDMRIVHRDVKLENILLNVQDHPEGNILLCDFGMAEFIPGSHPDDDSDNDPYDNDHHRPPPKVHGPADSSSTIAPNPETLLVGSLQYAAPELIESDIPIIHPYIDIWALGVVIYTLHCGELPFQHGLRPKLQAMIIEGKWDQALLESKLTSGFKDALEVTRGCLDKSTVMRWDVSRILDSTWLEPVADESP